MLHPGDMDDVGPGVDEAWVVDVPQVPVLPDLQWGLVGVRVHQGEVFELLQGPGRPQCLILTWGMPALSRLCDA